MNQTAVPLRIDFVSDVSCPWCAVGLGALEQALAHVGDALDVELHFQPFELNPHMPPGGQDITEHLTQKYGSTPEQQLAIREAIRQRGGRGGVHLPAARGVAASTTPSTPTACCTGPTWRASQASSPR